MTPVNLFHELSELRRRFHGAERELDSIGLCASDLAKKFFFQNQTSAAIDLYCARAHAACASASAHQATRGLGEMAKRFKGETQDLEAPQDTGNEKSLAETDTTIGQLVRHTTRVWSDLWYLEKDLSELAQKIIEECPEEVITAIELTHIAAWPQNTQDIVDHLSDCLLDAEKDSR